MRSKGLGFRRHRKKISVSAVKNVFVFAAKIAIVLFIAFVLVFCMGMRVTVAGSSMESTLSDGENVFVNRFIYSFSNPKSGDVVVFLPNGNEKSQYYIKRVVAVPGDTVQITDGVLYVNGEIYDDEDTEAIKNAGLAGEEITVGEDEYFVLGDNWNNSEDSRYANIGNVKEEYIVGKAWFYYSSFLDFGRVK
ncbi:MAG: signal peptidase I [Clostridiales bacterium]|nr:signal peptidase I [Clostridiales bacterium]